MKLEAKATIFDIQRFAVNDGPGVRTIVFFKGCPLHCRWCHNPESLAARPQLMYFSTKCVGCRLCEQVCPNDVHSFQNGVHSVAFDQCEACGKCLAVCCYDALTISGKLYSVSEVLEQIEKDKEFFGENGGVTLSGGEPMFQAEFAILLARELQNRGINVCMETCGFARTELYRRIAPYIDQFLFDYKATPQEECKRLTGGNSELILKNLHLLNYLGKKIILRCPMIPEVNDTDEHLQAIANLQAGYPMIDHVELLPYHTMGEMKRVQIGEKADNEFRTATQQEKDRWIQTLETAGCKVKFA